jgi:hypothetical protein
MFFSDDDVLGPCPWRCGGIVILLGPTIRAVRAENMAKRGVDPPADEAEPRCDHCDYQVEDRAAYIRDLRAWRDAVMGAAHA